MLVRFVDHLKHNVAAYLALFIVLGGTAVALPGKGTVTSNDIAKKAVKSKNIAKKAVKTKNIAKQAVKTKNIADGAVTGDKADEASFEGLVKGDGRQSTATVTASAVGFLPEPITLAEVPTMGVVEFIGCFDDSAGADIRTRLLSFDDSQPFFGAGTVIGGGNPSGVAPGTTTEQTSGIFSAGGGVPLIAESDNGQAGATGVSGWWDWHLTRGTGEDTVGAHVSVSGLNTSTAGSPGECTVTATTEYQD